MNENTLQKSIRLDLETTHYIESINSEIKQLISPISRVVTPKHRTDNFVIIHELLLSWLLRRLPTIGSKGPLYGVDNLFIVHEMRRRPTWGGVCGIYDRHRHRPRLPWLMPFHTGSGL